MDRYKTIQKKTFTNDAFLKAMEEVKVIDGVLQKLGLRPRNETYRLFHKLVQENNIDLAQWSGVRKNGPIDVADQLTEHSTARRPAVKRWLLKCCIFEEKCAGCGNSEWQDKKIPLQLHHINGVWDDNRIENLQFLCPTCHAMTESFAGGNKHHGLPMPPEKKQCHCGKPILRISRECKSCANSKRLGQGSKADWPTDTEMEELLRQLPAERIAKKLGVSGTMIYKHCQKRGISKPGRGYWAGKVPSKKQTITDKVLAGRKRRGEKARKIGPDGTAWCCACRQFLVVSNFGRKASRWNGLSNTCKLCRSKTRSPKKHHHT